MSKATFFPIDSTRASMMSPTRGGSGRGSRKRNSDSGTRRSAYDTRMAFRIDSASGLPIFKSSVEIIVLPFWNGVITQTASLPRRRRCLEVISPTGEEAVAPVGGDFAGHAGDERLADLLALQISANTEMGMRSGAELPRRTHKVSPVPPGIVEHVERLSRGEGAPAVLVVKASGYPLSDLGAQPQVEVLLPARTVHQLRRAPPQVGRRPLADPVPVEIGLVEQQHRRVGRAVQRGVRIADVECD